MTDLIESLLLFSQTGQILNLHYESVGALVERTVQAVRQHPDCREVQVSASDIGSVEAWIDSKKLGRAIYNLLLNACQVAAPVVTPISGCGICEPVGVIKTGTLGGIVVGRIAVKEAVGHDLVYESLVDIRYRGNRRSRGKIDAVRV